MIQLAYACIYIHRNSKQLTEETLAHPCSFTVGNRSSSIGTYQQIEWIKNIYTARDPGSRE